MAASNQANTANTSSNGTTVTFGNKVLGELESVEDSEEGAKVQITGMNAEQKLYSGGVTDAQASITAKGSGGAGNMVHNGDTGNVAIAYKDGGNRSLGKCVATSVRRSAAEDQAIRQTITVVPTTDL